MGTVDTHALRTSYPLPDVAAAMNITLRKTGNEYRSHCPFHGGQSGTTFAIYWASDHWRWICFGGCGEGDLFDFLMAMNPGMTFPQACETLTGPGFCRSPQSWTPPPIEQPRNPPLSQRPAAYYHGLIDRPNTRGRTPRDWWHDRGVSDEIIARYRLGFCPHCPTAYDKQAPDRRWPSMTIPIPGGDPAHDHTIRHRLIPEGPGGAGDKYRPQRKRDGVALFGANQIAHGTASGIDMALILEGEVKKLVGESCGLESFFVLVSATSGMRTWLRGHGHAWVPLFDNMREIYVLFDPDMRARDAALHTARLFGRRGRLVHLPGKFDDFLLIDPEERLPTLLNAIGSAQRVTARLFSPGA